MNNKFADGWHPKAAQERQRRSTCKSFKADIRDANRLQQKSLQNILFLTMSKSISLNVTAQRLARLKLHLVNFDRVIRGYILVHVDSDGFWFHVEQSKGRNDRARSSQSIVPYLWAHSWVKKQCIISFECHNTIHCSFVIVYKDINVQLSSCHSEFFIQHLSRTNIRWGGVQSGNRRHDTNLDIFHTHNLVVWYTLVLTIPNTADRVQIVTDRL